MPSASASTTCTPPGSTVGTISSSSAAPRTATGANTSMISPPRACHGNRRRRDDLKRLFYLSPLAGRGTYNWLVVSKYFGRTVHASGTAEQSSVVALPQYDNLG